MTTDVKRGQKRHDGIGEYRVMVVADNYAMVRRPYAAPFVIPVKDVAKHPFSEDLKKEADR